MKNILFGPGGLGPVKDAVNNLTFFSEVGIKACEIEFTYGIYIKENQAPEIKKTAEKLGIKLSIHAQYWINLNSEDKEKIEKSKKRILDCCKIGHALGAKKIVFHPGFYGKSSKQETYENIKNQILELQETIKENKWDVELAPETTGKVNVFGSIEEIKNLVKDTKCSFTIDFSHIFARNQGNITYKEIIAQFSEFDNLHCHFSGIEFGEKGEKKHIKTTARMWRALLKELKNKKATIINESPTPVEDSILGIQLSRN